MRPSLLARAVALLAVGCLACFALPTPAPLPQRISDFEAWLAHKGARILDDAVDIAPSATPGGGIGLLASRDLTPPTAGAAGTAPPPPLVLFSLPLSMLFSIEHVFLDEWAQLHLESMSDTEAMAIYLARMRIQGGQQANKSVSEWDAWVQLLPERFDTNPLFWSTAQLDKLQSSLLRRFIARRLARAERSYAMLAAEVRAEVPYSDFLWGLAVLWSRTHGVRIKDREGAWHKAPAFVPMADLLNMPSTGSLEGEGGAPQQANVECATNQASTHFECILIAPVRKGEELLVPYGGASNAGSSAGGGGGGGMGNGQLLLDYGFAMENNHFDILQFEVPSLRAVGSYPLPAASDAEEGGVPVESRAPPIVEEVSPELFELQSSLISSVLRRGDPLVPALFQFHYPPARMAHGGDDPASALPAGLLQLLRVHALDAATLARMGGVSRARDVLMSRIKQDVPLSAHNEVSALRLLQRAILEALVSYGSSMTEDETELAAVNTQLQQLDDASAGNGDAADDLALDPDSLLVSRYALLLRMGEKRLLFIYAGILTNYMHKLAPQLENERKRATTQQAHTTARAGKHDEL